MHGGFPRSRQQEQGPGPQLPPPALPPTPTPRPGAAAAGGGGSAVKEKGAGVVMIKYMSMLKYLPQGFVVTSLVFWIKCAMGRDPLRSRCVTAF